MNPLLSKTRAAILAKVDPRLQKVVLKMVNAGHQIMFSPQTRHLLQQQLQGNAQNPEAVGSGIAKLLGILFNKSKKTAPVQALIPAGMVLMCDGLDFLEESGAVQVTSQFLAQCTQAAGSAILQMLGVKPEQVQQAMSQVQAQSGRGGRQPIIAGAQGATAVPPAPPARGVIGGAMAGGA